MGNTQHETRDRTLDEARRNDRLHRRQALKRSRRAYRLWDEAQLWIGWTLALTVPFAFVYSAAGYLWCGLAWMACFALYHLLKLVKEWLVARIIERL